MKSKVMPTPNHHRVKMCKWHGGNSSYKSLQSSISCFLFSVALLSGRVSMVLYTNWKCCYLSEIQFRHIHNWIIVLIFHPVSRLGIRLLWFAAVARIVPKIPNPEPNVTIYNGPKLQTRGPPIVGCQQTRNYCTHLDIQSSPQQHEDVPCRGSKGLRSRGYFPQKKIATFRTAVSEC